MDICKRGHDQTIEGARDKGGACIECNRVRYLERKAARSTTPPTEPNEVPSDIIAALLELQATSSRVRGATPVGHEFRKAGDLLAEMAVNAMDEYGVTVTKLSRQMGLSDKTMSSFLMRRGAIPAAPHMEAHAYQNVAVVGPKKRDRCRRGHDVSNPSAREENGKGNCKQCRRERQRQDYWNRKEAA